ncbi:hypothetical protein B0H14DRAFT_2497450 [Mycena olivaceomarginata]|nr:hypothetical protein B0H14DRAFT_2497450 [Mycena olivaceomarginata]
MFCFLRLILILLCGASSHINQIPFLNGSPPFASSPSGSLWDDLSAPPDTNWTGHLIFDTVNSLLQHWPNTRYRNGHTIVPGHIPVGTLLYHGRGNSAIPTHPEWTATDPEHAFPWCRDSSTTNSSITGCWQLTLVATRPLKVLHFDGTSGAKMKDGPLDAQDLIIWGEVAPTRSLDERARINDLCAWGKGLGIDGYVRMEMDFEVMLCDFFHGVELISADYLAAWTEGYDAPASLSHHSKTYIPNCWPSTRSLRGSWHNHYPGETRIRLDLRGLISFYDTSLAPSLIAHREGKERWDHRLLGISARDLAAVNGRLREVLTTGTKRESEIDWHTLYRVLVDRYAGRLETLEYLLNVSTAADLRERAQAIQIQLRVMLTPYILYTARPNYRGDSGIERWARSVWHACATKHTAHIHRSPSLRLTLSERLLLGARDGTNREICRVVVRMWTTGVRLGLDPFIPGQEDVLSPSALLGILGLWRTEIYSLMAWLDWSAWIKCRPTCSLEEMCYLPTWPFFEWNDGLEGKDESWKLKRPQPRCIRKFGPYSSL